MRKRKKRSANQEPKERKPEEKSDGRQFRAAVMEIRAGEGDAPAAIVMSVSSEEPVLTFGFYNDRYQQVWEILDHAESSIDMSRAKDGLVVQDTHHGDQIGLMDVKVKDRKLGGPVEFCSGDRAQEISKDAANGLRRNVSVGYMIREDSLVFDGDKDGIPVVRVMSWTPYEASFVSVPADTTVGVSRAKKEDPQKVEPVKKEERKMLTGKEMAKLFARAAKYGIEADKVTELIDVEEGV
ncbi:unnamed protein product, partial [marine sediment metagenome]